MKWTLVILLSVSFSTADGSPLSGCSVSAEVGETVILPVKVDLPQDSEMLQPIINWKNERGGIVHDYWYVHDVNTFQDECFKGRTSLFKEEINKGNFSLKICNVTKNDTGKYICEVHNQVVKSYKVTLCMMEKGGHKGPPKSPNPDHSDLTLCLIVGIVIGVLGLAAALIVVFLYRRCTLTEKPSKAIYLDAGVETEKLRGGDP